MSGGEAGYGRRDLVVLVAVLATIYAVSQFLRNSVGVIAPDLARDLALAPEELGILSGAFFLSFALVQLPLGMAIDRWGPRAVLLSSTGLAIAGSVLFAVASGLTGLTLARILMGLGCSTFYMAPLALYTRWFPPERFSSAVSFQYGLGNVGTLLATAPLALAVSAIGWRGSFHVMAAATAAIAVIVALRVRDAPGGGRFRDGPVETPGESLRGVIEVMGQRHAWRVFAMHFLGYSSYVTVLGLWGARYLTDVHGLGLEARGNVLLVLAVAQIVGVFGWGPLDRVFGTRKRLVMVGAAAQAAILLALALAPPLPLAGLLALLVAFGLASAYLPVMVAHGRALFSHRLVGRGLTFMNTAVMGGAFVMQAATGVVAGLASGGAPGGGTPLPAGAYEAVFLFLAAALAVATAIYAGAGDRPPAAGVGD